MRAAIDLGSNSVLLTVVDPAGAVLHDECRVVGLGKGLGDGGVFVPDRMDAALAALRDYSRTASALGVEPSAVRAVATSAARRATNAEAFFAVVAEEAGFGFEVISGEEEARLTWLGALSSLSLPDGDVCVVDLGGGSTELAVGRAALEWRHSYEIGTVRLTERVLGALVPPATPEHLERMRAHAANLFTAKPVEREIRTVVGVAGTVTTLMATELGLSSYDGRAVHGATLTAESLRKVQFRLLGLDDEARKALFPVSPERADHMLSGATILCEALEALGADRMVVSDRGLRYGLLGAT